MVGRMRGELPDTRNPVGLESVISGVAVRAGGVVGVGLSLLLAAGLASACSRSSSTPPPPASASPEQVAQFYLRAAKAQDCDVTSALTLPHTWNWCDDPRLLDYRSVRAAYLEPAKYAGVDQQCVPFEMNTHASGIGWQHEGWQPWELCFVKTSTGWRLYDQGQG
jgi:hypothetical protein